MRRIPGADAVHRTLSDAQFAALFRRNQQDFRPWLSELAARSYQTHHGNSAKYNARMLEGNKLMRHHLPELHDKVFRGQFTDAKGHPLNEIMTVRSSLLERMADVGQNIQARIDSLSGSKRARQYFPDIEEADPLSSWLMSRRVEAAVSGQRYHSEAPAWFDPSRFDPPNLGALDVADDELARQLAPLFEYGYGAFPHSADSFAGEVRVRVRRVDDGSGPKGWVKLETTASPRVDVGPFEQQAVQLAPVQQSVQGPIGKQPEGPGEIALVAERAQYVVQQTLGSMNEPVRYGVRGSWGDGIHTVSRGRAYGSGTPLTGMPAGRAKATLQGNFRSWPGGGSGSHPRDSVLDPTTRIHPGMREPGTTIANGSIFGPLPERYVHADHLSDGYIYKPWDYVEAALARPEGFDVVVQPGRAPFVEFPSSAASK